jgi:hypothetical protein
MRIVWALWPWYASCVAFGVVFVAVAVYDRAWPQAAAGVLWTLLAFVLARVGRRRQRGS